MQVSNGTPPYTLAVIAGVQLDHRGLRIALTSRKARTLLCYLALSGARRHSRESLAALLWDDASPAQARASLRQVLAGLNKALDGHAPLLNVTGDEISLHPGQIATDWDALRDEIARGLPGPDAARMIADLRHTLLTDMAAQGALDTWRRDTCQQMLAEAQMLLEQVFSDPQQPRATRLRAGQAALALDEFDEAAIRAIMACHVEAGNSVAALRLYGVLHARLEAEMDAEPSVETQALAVAIKTMEVGTAAPSLKNATLPARSGDPANPVADPVANPVASAPAAIAVPPSLAVVAVLPFEFLGADPLPDFVALGLLDQITCQLAGYRAPAVISSNTTRRFRGLSPTLAQLRQDLQATYAVTGSLLRQGSQASVSVQLVDTATAFVLWAGTFHCATEALFDIRAAVADNIANAIMPSVDLAELRRIEDQPNVTLAPYHLVLQAKDLIFRLEQGNFAQAGRLLAEANDRDPHFAPAHALRAEWHALRLWQGWSADPTADRNALEHHVSRAIALSPGSGRSLALLGHCRMLFERRHAEALTLFDTALSLLPNDAETLMWTVPTLAFSGDADTAIRNGDRASLLSPLDPFAFRNEHFLSIAHFVAGNHDRAADLGLSSFRRAPDYGSNLRMTIAALVAAGRRDEAVPLVTHHGGLVPDFSVTAFMPQHGLRDAAARARFGDLLIAAGLPA